MTRFLIVDTCVWINLAGEPKLYSLLEALEKTLEKTDLVLVLPKSVKVEFDRHRNKIKADWKNKCKGWVSLLKQIRRHFPEHSKALLEIHNDLQNTLAISDLSIEDNLKLVDYLFQKATLINNCSESMLAEAGKRVFYRVPPALNSKNSGVGDCLLWLCVLEMLKSGEVWFCTDNKHDFSQNSSEHIPHETLDEEAFQANTKGAFNYFIDLNKFIEHITPSANKLPKYSEYVDYDLPPYFRYELDRDSWMKPIVCPSCKSMCAFPQLFSTGYRYICANCGKFSQFITADDLFF